MFLTCFQDAGNFGEATRRRYGEFARRAGLVVALGQDMPEMPVPGVRGGPLAADDPLRQHWVVIVLGSQFATALAARDLGTGGPDRRRQFEYVITHDRNLVIDTAQPMLHRFASFTS